MKRIFESIFVILCLGMFSAGICAQVNLPKVTIAGSEYFIYESKKGDSLYGISNRYGWNLDQLMKLNPSLNHKLKKGEKVYFPVNAEDSNYDDTPVVFSAESYPVIQHLVKKGDSVYSISKMYGVPVNLIYTYNPDSKNGLKRGSVITLPQQPDDINDGSSFLFYAIRPGDTLAGIARTYNTSVEQLLRDNKGVSENNFEAGDLLRVSVNSKNDYMVTETVDETKLARIESYTAGKDDTWESVAQKTNTDIHQLKDMNAGLELKKNAHIDFPVIETSRIEREVVASDERENSEEGVRDIYNNVHRLVNSDSFARDTVNVALIIEDPQSKRDNEFARGALLAIDRLKNSPFSIRFKLLQDSLADADSVKVEKALIDSLDLFSPQIVIATHEKNFPGWLARYGEENGVEIVNSFDVKSELYMENPSVIHLLTPSAYFSEAVAEWEYSAFPDYNLIMAGKKDSDDAYADAILSKLDATPLNIDIEALGDMKLDDFGHYLIYGYPTSKEEVSSLLHAVSALKDANPLANVKVFGRLNWITLAEDMKDLFAKADVYFPSRFYFDHNGADGKKFISDYSASFGHGPIRAYPTYAASGFDVMNYFIESLASNEGDFNAIVPEGKELQTPINLQRVGNWGGFFNPSSYIIRYTPYGDVEKILIRK
ncbi:MAG: LysM peptidoglycan-binding domain-containing protein [Muribaculum sp.]|nr:LysM peptidoglycan-binding domain-containing protein [Muribaculum sp.]